MENYVDGFDIPLRFVIVLAKNIEAMNYFVSLNKERQNKVIERTYINTF